MDLVNEIFGAPEQQKTENCGPPKQRSFVAFWSNEATKCSESLDFFSAPLHRSSTNIDAQLLFIIK